MHICQKHAKFACTRIPSDFDPTPPWGGVPPPLKMEKLPLGISRISGGMHMFFGGLGHPPFKPNFGLRSTALTCTGVFDCCAFLQKACSQGICAVARLLRTSKRRAIISRGWDDRSLLCTQQRDAMVSATPMKVDTTILG